MAFFFVLIMTLVIGLIVQKRAATLSLSFSLSLILQKKTLSLSLKKLQNPQLTIPHFSHHFLSFSGKFPYGYS